MEKLLKRLPKKYVNRVDDFYHEEGLIEGKYMLEFKNGYSWHEYESLPCKSVTEAINFIKQSSKE